MLSNRCIHGIEKSYCAYCDGSYYQKQKQSKHIDHELAELKERHEVLKTKYKSFGDLWTDDEIYIVYDRLKDITKNKLIKEFYKVSYEIERTKNAVAWMYSHIFSNKNDLHRGNAVKNFRAMLEKQKEVIVP